MNFNYIKYPTLGLAHSVQRLRLLPIDKLPILCNELRRYLLETISQTSGHLASNLGVVELTVALHYVLNTPFDNLIWDVGHQAYLHKILTGRRNDIHNIRKKNGLYSFPFRLESKYDIFGVGHSSTSISAGIGLAVASQKENKDRKTVCIIGDGAITSGIAFEGINNICDKKINLLIILNNNNMSISKNVGGLHKYLSNTSVNQDDIIKYKSQKMFCTKKNFMNTDIEYQKEYLKILASSNTFLKNFGLKYFGPLDGHDVYLLIDVISRLGTQSNVKLLHIKTKKGKGYFPSELNPIEWHSVPKFDISSGVFYKTKKNFLHILKFLESGYAA